MKPVDVGKPMSPKKKHRKKLQNCLKKVLYKFQKKIISLLSVILMVMSIYVNLMEVIVYMNLLRLT